jgi:hypothetical protein
MTQDRPIVFIGGLHRSGTTLLADILSKHPEVGGLENTTAIENEGQYLQTVLPIDRVFGGPGRFAFRAGYRDHVFAGSAVAAGREMRESWEPFWPRDARVVLEKTPGNLLRTILLRRMYPSAKFVFMIRHPIASAIATQKWSHTGIFCMLEHWLTAYDYLEEIASAGIEYVLVPYEDFCRRPKEILSQLFEFIGVEPREVETKRVADMNESYFQLWRQYYYKPGTRAETPPRKPKPSGFARLVDRIGYEQKVWLKRTALAAGYQIAKTRHEGEDAVAVFEGRVNRYGYSLTDLERYPRLRRFSTVEPAAPAAFEYSEVE